jgi:hypothetical protein
MKVFAAALLAACAIAQVSASALWDYVNKPDSAYAWRDTGFRYNEKGKSRDLQVHYTTTS